jgi:hypothetical protein
MKNNWTGGRRGGADDFTQFQARPDVRLLMAKYADYPRSPEGLMTSIQLSCFGISYLSGIWTREQHQAAVIEFGAGCDVPLADLLLMAECQLHILKLMRGAMARDKSDSGGDDHGRAPTWSVH